MKVKVTETFIRQLSRQVAFIAFDKPTAARRFKKDVFSFIKNFSDFPFKNRKSIYFEEDNFRDAIFKGYVLTYEVLEKEIVVFAITKYRMLEK